MVLLPLLLLAGLQATPIWTLVDRGIELRSATGAAVEFGRVSALTRDADGTFFVVDQFEGRIYSFSSQGIMQGASGRKGAGPGELAHAVWADNCAGDSLFVADARLNRISVFDQEAQFIRLMSIPSEAGPAVPRYFSCSHGQLVLGTWPRIPPNRKQGPFRNRTQLRRFSTAGQHLGFVASVPANEMYLRENGAYERPLGARTIIETAGDRIFIGDGSKAFIEVMRAGFCERWPLPWKPRPLARGAVNAYVDRRLAPIRNDNRRRHLRRTFLDLEWPDQYPVFTNIIADAGGRLWVQQYPSVEDEVGTWAVLSDSGEVIASVKIPINFKVFHIGHDSVTGLWRNRMLGASEVRVYGIQRSPLTPGQR